MKKKCMKGALWNMSRVLSILVGFQLTQSYQYQDLGPIKNSKFTEF